MGGSALKHVETKRLTTKEFEEIKKELIPKLIIEFKTEIYPLKYYFDKQDHGDLDLLVKIPCNQQKLIKQILYNIYECNEVYYNDYCYSFDYKGFQVDLILIDDKYFEVAKIFYDFNDLGILVGKIANHFGLKFGEYGLKFVLYSRDRTQKLRRIHLTSNIEKVFYILGLDYERYKWGFKNLEELFNYIAYSKYFYKYLGTLEYLSSDQRHRDKKRKNIKLFETWLKDKNDIPEFNEKFNFDQTIELINKEFPEINLNAIIKKEYEKLDIGKQVIEKFNGYIIMNRFPSLRGEALGKAINKFKYSLDKNYNDFILNNSLEDIITRFEEVNNVNFEL